MLGPSLESAISIPRPSVLLVDPDTSRRRSLAHGLSGCGYEVVPAVGEEEGRRYARSLGPGIVVAPASLKGAAELLASSSGEQTLLLLGASEEEAKDLADEVLFLVSTGLSGEELVRRIHVALLGRELGLAPDAELSCLVGDFALQPFLELIRAVSRARLTGRISSSPGEAVLAEGNVVSAAAGAARGVKAFCRLAHLDAGPFHLHLDVPEPVNREIHEETTALVLTALEDFVHDAPDLRSRVRVSVGTRFFETRFTPRQQELLAVAPRSGTVAQLLDALPELDGRIVRDLLDLAELGVVTLEPPQERVCIVTDSTADLPPELARAHGIRVIPVLVQFGERVYRDGVNLKAKEFYELLATSPVRPHTNPPPRTDFFEVYRGLAGEREVVSIHLSEKLSQTVVNARQAAETAIRRGVRGEPEGLELRVVDSGSVSLGLGLFALFAARMAQRGLEPGAIVERLAAMRPRMHVSFIVESLEHLHRAGRLGKAQSLLGTLLGIKPILGVVDGEVVAVDKVRGGRAAQPRLVELLAAKLDPARPVVAGIAHAKAPVWADRLRQLVEARFTVRELVVAELGPVLAANAGPGTVGAAVFQPEQEEWPWIEPREAGVAG